ncbi:copper transporter [Marinisporobacter balticus]|uniref:Copper transport outer membrane protein MctB n=1 Tax=Marinisporobacter balticus TaxID=2018667 RepID=A0A4R2L0E6_9FIRM|nr:copper transporter [Marinisporobacter balticus]TCO79874.1 copper transport outer membrane protein MctB [Marinisporobacter balticus]
MVINLKYYLITIVAIFLAIGIGIFIGIMLDGQDLIVEQQREVVSQLESKFDEFKIKQDTLQEKIDTLNLEKEKNEKFVNTMYPELVKEKLKDLNVVILETSEHYEYSGITDAFKKAGVNSVSNIITKELFILDDENDLVTLASDFGLTGNSKEELQTQLIKKFTSSLVSENGMEIIKNLKDKKMIDYGDDLTGAADYIIVAGGSIDEQKIVLNNVEVPIINFFKNNNIPVMAVEKLEVPYSNILDYKKLRISTVDNVDTMIGKISMLMVVSGQEGHFGEKETAESLMPEGFKTVD